MPPFRNFFEKRPTVTKEPVKDENQPPSVGGAGKVEEQRQRPSLNIGRGREEEPNEYKMSVVNDSGIYLPPSPTEKKGFWSRSPSRNTSNHRDLLNENEPFSISRESFDSYRRSFDISARSPVSRSDTGASRTSLDSRISRTTPRSGVSGSFERPQSTEEEIFEDIGLTDEPKPKKRSFFARFGDSAAEAPPSAENSRPPSSHHGFHLPGRKRGLSGQGAELGHIPKPIANEVN